VNFSAVAKGLKVDCIVTRYYEIVCQIAVKTLSRSCISSFVIQFNTYFVCQIAVKTLSRSCISSLVIQLNTCLKIIEQTRLLSRLYMLWLTRSIKLWPMCLLMHIFQ